MFQPGGAWPGREQFGGRELPPNLAALWQRFQDMQAQRQPRQHGGFQLGQMPEGMINPLNVQMMQMPQQMSDRRDHRLSQIMMREKF